MDRDKRPIDAGDIPILSQLLSMGLPCEIVNSLRRAAPAGMWQRNPEAALAYGLVRLEIFDVRKYLENNPDVAAAGMDPYIHFCRHGINEQRPLTLVAKENTKEKSGVPKVSILVPVFNNSEFLEECFNSIVNQTLRDIEVIIIDDGSTDKDAICIMEKYAENDKRIKLIRKANSGYGHSMNVGLEHAIGKYIGIVESDDYIQPRMYELLYNLAENNQLDFIKGDYNIFYGDQNKRKKNLKKIFWDTKEYNKVLHPHSRYAYFQIYMVIWNGIYRRDFINKNNIRFNESPGASFQDNGFWFQTMMFANRIMLIEEPLYNLRRDNPGSSIHSKDKAFCMIKEYEFIYNIIRESTHLRDKFIKFFQYKKFQNYIGALQRVDKKYRKELLKLYKTEFASAFERGEIDKVIFQNDYNAVKEIATGRFAPYYLNSPVISVVMPVYNAAQFLKETMDSILMQTYGDLELICVDDGSQDASPDILMDYMEKSKRVSVYRQKNQGPGAARNTGLAHAGGDYVIFLDADDKFDKNMLMEMLIVMQRDSSDFCLCQSESLDVRTKAKNKLDFALNVNALPPSGPFNFRQIAGNIFKAMAGWAWDKMYSKKFIDKHKLRFPYLRSSEDMLFVYQGLLYAEKISALRKTLVTHRINIQTSVSNTRELSPEDFIFSLKGMRDTLRAIGCYEHYKTSMASYAVHTFLWHLRGLRGMAAVKLHRVKAEFSAAFEVDRLPRESFFNRNEYEEYINL